MWSFLMGDGGGYCVHFATAYALLARLNGIPARYVTGFLVNLPSDSDTVDVPGFASHAWVEIWTPDEGWITQEATPPMLPGHFDDPAYYEMYNPFNSSYTARQLELIMGERVGAPREKPKREARDIDPAPVLFTLAGLLAAAGLVWFFAASSYAPAGRKRRLRLALRAALRKSLKVGAPHPERVGWLHWADSVTELTGADARPAAHIVHRTFFGYADIDVDSIAAVRSLRRDIGRSRRAS